MPVGSGLASGPTTPSRRASGYGGYGPGMAEHVRVRKAATRRGRPEMLDDGHVVEGDELEPPAPGVPYRVRRTVVEHEDAPEVFATSPVRAVITSKVDGTVSLMTDNSRYIVEIVGR